MATWNVGANWFSTATGDDSLTVTSLGLNDMTLLDPLSSLDTNTNTSITKNTTATSFNNTTFEPICFLTEVLDTAAASPFDYTLRARVSFDALPSPSVGTNVNFGLVLTDSATSPTSYVGMGVGKSTGGDIYMRQVSQGGSAGSNIVGADATYNVRSMEVNFLLQGANISRGGTYQMYDNAQAPVSAGSGDGAFLPFTSTFSKYYIGVFFQEANGEALTVSGISLDYWILDKPTEFPDGP